MKKNQTPLSPLTRRSLCRRWRLPVLALIACAIVMPAQAEEKAVARIVTQNSDPANCISRVAVRTINGENKFVSPQGFNLKPGKYTLSGTVALDTRYCKVAPGNSYHSVPPLEAEFEAGKTYYIGFDHSSSNREDWAYVIWKVE